MADPGIDGEKYAVQRRDVARRVIRLRQEAGLSQEELAERVGIHRSHLARIEAYAQNITLNVLFGLAEALEVPATDLLQHDR